MRTIISNLKRATIEMLLLRLLAEEDMYGYQLTQEIKKRSNGEITILEGSMYPILYRLTENGDVESREEKVGIRMTRVYYHLTESGRERFHNLVNTFYQQVDLVKSIIEMDKDNA